MKKQIEVTSSLPYCWQKRTKVNQVLYSGCPSKLFICPSHLQVMRALDSITDLLDFNNGIRPGESEFFDSAQQSDIRFFQRMAFGSHEFDSDFSQASWRTNSREV